jgi:hypothetical protein
MLQADTEITSSLTVNVMIRKGSLTEKHDVDDDDDDDDDNNSIRVYLRANLTAHRSITKLAQVYRNTQK